MKKLDRDGRNRVHQHETGPIDDEAPRSRFIRHLGRQLFIPPAVPASSDGVPVLDYRRQRAAVDRRPAHPAAWVVFAAVLGRLALIASQYPTTLLWCGGPLLLVGGLAIAFRWHLLCQILLLPAAVAISAVTGWAFGQVNHDAQGPLVLLFAPIYFTWPIALLTTVAVSVAWAVRQKEQG